MERNKLTGTIGETVMLEYDTIKLLNKYGIYREEILLEACPKFNSQFAVALKKAKEIPIRERKDTGLGFMLYLTN